VVVFGPAPNIGWCVPLVLAAYPWRGWALPDGPPMPEFMAKERKVMPASSGCGMQA
jgi:hypothetical protein